MHGWQPSQYDPAAHRQRLRGPQPGPAAYGCARAPLPAAPRRRAFPPYPVHLLPRSRRRRHGIFFYVWLGSHPVLLLISAVVCLYVWAFLLGWVALVTVCWLIGGLVALPFRGLR